MFLFFHIAIVLYPAFIFAQGELAPARSSPPTATRPAPQGRATETGVFSPYLGCVNRLKAPIARRLAITTDENPTPEQNTTIFSGRRGNDIGFYVVRSGMATFDTVTLRHSSLGLPTYPLSFTYRDGRELLFHYLANQETGRGEAAGYGFAPNMRERNPGVIFEPIGRSESQISTNEGITGIVEETLPAIMSIPQSIDEADRILSAEADPRISAEADPRNRRNRRQELLDQAKEALCACVRTNNERLVSASLEVAEILKMKDDVSRCSNPLISKNGIQVFRELFFPRAHATRSRDNGMNSSEKVVKFPESLVSVSLNGRKLIVCGQSKSWNVSYESGQIISEEKACPKSLLRTKTRLVSNSKVKIRLEGEILRITSN